MRGLRIVAVRCHCRGRVVRGRAGDDYAVTWGVVLQWCCAAADALGRTEPAMQDNGPVSPVINPNLSVIEIPSSYSSSRGRERDEDPFGKGRSVSQAVM